MAKKIDIVKQNVKLLVENNPDVKDCYNLLIICYWEKYEAAKTLRDAKHCTPAETITRAFRSLVRKGEIALDKVTKGQRKDKRKEFYNHFIKEVES